MENKKDKEIETLQRMSMKQIENYDHEKLVESIINTVSMEAMWTLSCSPSEGFCRWRTEPPGDSHVED